MHDGIDDSHLSSPPENDLDHVENDVSQNKNIGHQGSMVKKQELNWVETKPAMKDDWNSCLLTFEGHQESVQVASWMSNDRLVSASFDGTVKMWDTSTSHCVSTFTGNGASISSIGCLRSPNIGLVLGDERIEIWDTREDYRLSSSNEAIQPLRIDVLGFEDTVELFTISSWSHEGALAYATEDGLILIHHVTGMTRQDTSTALQGRHRGVYTLAWSHDGRIASGAKDGSIKIWDAADGQCKLEPGGHSEWVYALAWSKDCRRLASASKENIIKIWETKNGLCTAWVEGHSSLVRSLSWSPDGRLAGADDEVIRIWDSITGKCLSVLEGHKHQVWSIAWSDNGTRLASASRDKTIKVWDVAENQMERALLRSNQRISGIYLPADESRPASML